MPTCPKGHDSAATDYCDECGTPMGGQATPAVQAGGTAAAPAAGAAAGGGEPCPQCATPRTGRFCEVCGHDFVAADLSGGAGTTNGAAGTPPAAEGGAGGAGTGTAGTGTGDAAPAAGIATGNGTGSGNAGPGNGSGGQAAGGLPVREPATANWLIAVAADREYHARMQAIADPEVEEIAFPAFYPERRFVLHGAQMLIGRKSKSRGIEPDIDLTGPPADPAVSHAHAMLVFQPGGGWALVDLGSANGTYLNDQTEAIDQNVPVPLSDGDQIHIGAFSTLTVRKG